MKRGAKVYLKKRINNKIIILLISFIILIAGSFTQIKAASFYLSGPGSVSAGQTFNVSITASNMYAKISVSVSGPGVLISAPADVDNGTVVATVKSTGAGTITVSASGVGSDYDNPYDQNVSSAVNIQSVNNSSSGGSNGSSGGGSNNGGSTSNGNQNDANNGTEEKEEEKEPSVDLSLSSLSIKDAKLSPEFSSAVSEYTTNVPKDTKKVTVEAQATNAETSISGVGEHDVVSGDNKISVVVKSNKTGETKTYTINVYVEETPSAYLPGIGSKELGILSLKSAPVLDGFEDYTLNIKGKEVQARKSNLMKLVLLYMDDGKGNKNYYIYDEKKKEVTSIYIPIALLGNNYAIISIPENMQKTKGLKYDKVKIEEQEFDGWSFEEKSFKNYSLVYLMNDKGETHLYQYENTMKTLQLYSNAAAITQEKYDKLGEQASLYQILTFSFIAISVVFGATSVVLVTLQKNNKRKSKKVN